MARIRYSGGFDMAFHLFSINEVYANADGAVQYVEPLGLSSGPNFFGGHTLTAQASAGFSRTSFLLG